MPNIEGTRVCTACHGSGKLEFQKWLLRASLPLVFLALLGGAILGAILLPRDWPLREDLLVVAILGVLFSCCFVFEGFLWLIGTFRDLYQWGIQKKVPSCPACRGLGQLTVPGKTPLILKVLIFLFLSGMALLWLINNGYIRL